MVKHRQSARKQDLNYLVLSEFSPKVVGPALDWREASSVSCEAFGIVTVTEVGWSRRGRQLSGEAKCATKHKLIWCGAHIVFSRNAKA